MITIQIETFSATHQEALPLCEKHWDEVPFGKWPELGLELNIELYTVAEQLGNILLVTARDDGAIVGYLLLLGCEMNHHKGHWHATSDVVYVDPSYRGSSLFAKMLAKAKEECEDKGVTFLSIGVNPNYDFSSMLESNGAICTEKTYTWRI